MFDISTLNSFCGFAVKAKSNKTAVFAVITEIVNLDYCLLRAQTRFAHFYRFVSMFTSLLFMGVLYHSFRCNRLRCFNPYLWCEMLLIPLLVLSRISYISSSSFHWVDLQSVIWKRQFFMTAREVFIWFCLNMRHILYFSDWNLFLKYKNADALLL